MHVVDNDVLHSQWDLFGCSGMAQHPLLTLQHWPPELPTSCDVCGSALSISIFHALYYKIGWLSMTCHSNLWFGVANLAGSYMRNNPLIHQGRDMREVNPSWLGYTKTIYQLVKMELNRWEPYWVATFGREGWIGFTTYLLWILAPSFTRKIHQRNVSRRQIKRRSRNIWGPASNSAVIKNPNIGKYNKEMEISS